MCGWCVGIIVYGGRVGILCGCSAVFGTCCVDILLFNMWVSRCVCFVDVFSVLIKYVMKSMCIQQQCLCLDVFRCSVLPAGGTCRGCEKKSWFMRGAGMPPALLLQDVPLFSATVVGILLNVFSSS